MLLNREIGKLYNIKLIKKEWELKSSNEKNVTTEKGIEEKEGKDYLANIRTIGKRLRSQRKTIGKNSK